MVIHSENRVPKLARSGEQGGVTILVTLVLLVLLSMAAFSLGRSVIRETSIAGSLARSAKATAAADAGLDWFMVWGDNYAPTGARAQTMVNDMLKIRTDITEPPVHNYTVSDFTSTTDPFLFSTTGTDIKQSKSNGNATVQAFNLSVRWIGPRKRVGSSVTTLPDTFWVATSTGRARVGDGLVEFQATREMFASN